MMTAQERVTLTLRNMPKSEAQSAVKAWATTEITLRKSVEQDMIETGWECVDVPAGQFVVGDGDDARPVTWVRDKAYALPPEVFRARRDEAIKAAVARERDARQRSDGTVAVPGEALTSVLCPKCRATMAKGPICPKCADGRRGFKILCSCTECGHEVKL